MPTKRRSEAAWIEARQRWQINVQKDGQRRTFTSSIKGRKGKHDAETKADEWLESGTVDMRFPQAWEIYFTYQQQRTGKSNCLKLDQYYRCYLAPNIGNRRLSGVTPIMWQKCIDAGAQKGLSERSCINIRGTIASFVSFALRSRWDVQRLEKGDLKIPKSAAPAKPKTVLQPNDIRTLFSEDAYPHYNRMEHAHYIHAWRFMVLTGLRRGELCGLMVSDLQGHKLTIQRSVNSLGELTEGKNANARRTIELGVIAMRVLKDESVYLTCTGIKSKWLFPDKWGERPDPNALYDQWVTYRNHHGITSNLHELRHTFISLNKSDLPMQLLKAVVGHSASMDTYAVYGHEIEGEQHRAAEIIDNVFENILEPKRVPKCVPEK